MEAIVETRQFLEQVPVGAAEHPGLTTGHHAHRAVAEAELHPTRGSAAEHAVTRLLAETGVEAGVVADRERRLVAGRLEDHVRSATLLQTKGRRIADRAEDVQLEDVVAVERIELTALLAEHEGERRAVVRGDRAEGVGRTIGEHAFELVVELALAAAEAEDRSVVDAGERVVLAGGGIVDVV